MFHRLTIAAALLGVLMPAAARGPEQPEPPQISTYHDGFFYSSGRSYLGLEVRDITADRVSALKLKEERGVEITMVDQDAPAGKAGLKEHDVILDYNGTRVESEEQLRRMIRETPPGRTAALGISRDGSPLTMTVQIGDRGKLSNQIFKNNDRNNTIFIGPKVPEVPEFSMPFDVQVLTYSPTLGIQTENLGQQLSDYFGVKSGQGVLVKSVEKGSTAEKAGMKAGDVITKLDKEAVSDRADLRRMLRSHRSGGKVTLGIVRDKHEQNLVIDLPARDSDDSSSLEFLPDVETLDDWSSTVQEWQPEMHELIHEKLQQLRPELIQAQENIKMMTPKLQESLRQVQSEMEKWQKDLRKSTEEWRWEFHDLL